MNELTVITMTDLKSLKEFNLVATILNVVWMKDRIHRRSPHELITTLYSLNNHYGSINVGTYAG